MMGAQAIKELPLGEEPGACSGGAAAMDRPIDLVHLSRMTLGDRSLEREVLQLFVRQAAMLLERMQTAPPPTVAVLAHTLKGSARGLGAWRAAAAAEAVERAASEESPGLPATIAALGGSVREASALITDLLRAH